MNLQTRNPVHPAQAELFREHGKRFIRAAGAPSQQEREALKGLIMDMLMDDHPAQRLLQTTALVPDACRQAWHLVTHTLLARRLETAGPVARGNRGADNNAHAIAWALERQWEQAPMLQRWERLVGQLDARQCQRLLRHAANCTPAH